MEIKIKVIRKVSSRDEHLCAFVVFYNSEGDETATQRSCSFQGKEDQWLYPGEIKSYKFYVPITLCTLNRETKEWIKPPYKVWLFKEK